MICPYCMNEKTKVVGTTKDLAVKRFRQCLRCDKVFVTTETLDYDEYWKKFKDETAKEPKDNLPTLCREDKKG